MCATTESNTGRGQPHDPEPPTPTPTAAAEQPQRQRQPSSRRRRRRYPQVPREEGDDDHESDSRSGAAAVACYVPPPAFVVLGNSSSSMVEGTTKSQKKLKTPTLPGAFAASSTPSLASSETSSSSSSSTSRDDRIRAKWIEMRAKDRRENRSASSSSSSSSSSLERMVGGTGGSGGGARRARGSDDDSCDTMMMMMMTTIVDDASDATLKVDNSNNNNNNNNSCSGAAAAAVGSALWMGASIQHPHHPHLYSTPIFEATLVAEPYDDDVDHRDESKVPDVHDPLEIMERARAVARQELLREAVTATAVIPIGDDEEDNNLDKDSDASSSSSSSSADPSTSKARAARRRQRWVRGAVIGAVLIVLWAAIAWAVAYFVSPRSGSSSTTTPTRPQASLTGSASLNSTSISSSSIVKYGAVSDEALGLSADGSVLAIGNLDAASMGHGGVVRILHRSNKTTSTEWIEQGVVTEDGMPYFGFAVGVAGSGQRLVVGAPGGVEIGDPDVVVPGAVRVYDYDATMNMWESPYADFSGLSQGGLFGHSVAISGDASTFVAGAPSADGMGMAQVWKLNNETRQWEKRGQELSIDVLDGHFGESTALSNDGRVLVVGGCGANAIGKSGSVVPYQFDADTDMWVAHGSPLLGNASMERWGWDVSVSGDGNVMAASANVFSAQNPGSVHVYRYNEAGNEWEPFGEALVGQLHDRFGYTVSLSHDGTTVAVGAPGEKGSGTGSVQVYAFDKYTHSWSPTLSPDVARGTSATDDLGEAVALSSDGTYVAASSSTGGYTEVFALN